MNDHKIPYMKSKSDELWTGDPLKNPKYQDVLKKVAEKLSKVKFGKIIIELNDNSKHIDVVSEHRERIEK